MNYWTQFIIKLRIKFNVFFFGNDKKRTKLDDEIWYDLAAAEYYDLKFILRG